MSGSAAAIIMTRLLRTQRELVARFTSAGAVSPERAIPRGELSRSSANVFAELARLGVFVPAGNDRWYFDQAAWERAQSRQKSRLLITAVVVFLLAAAFLTLWLTLAAS